MTESSHMVGIRGSFDPVLIPFSSFSPFSILGGPLPLAVAIGSKDRFYPLLSEMPRNGEGGVQKQWSPLNPRPPSRSLLDGKVTQ